MNRVPPRGEVGHGQRRQLVDRCRRDGGPRSWSLTFRPPTVGHTREHEVEWDQRCSDGCDGANNVLRGEPGMAPATPAPAEPSLEPPAQSQSYLEVVPPEQRTSLLTNTLLVALVAAPASAQGY